MQDYCCIVVGAADTIGQRHCHAQLVPTLLLWWRASVCHCWHSVILPLAYDAIDTFNSSTVWGASQIVIVNATMLSLCYSIMVDTPSWAIRLNPVLKGHWDQSSKAMRMKEHSWEPHRGLCASPESGIKREKGILVTRCILFITGGLGSPEGQINGSLIKVRDWAHQ